MLNELVSYFSRVQAQLHDLCEVIFSNEIQNDPSINDGNVVCKNGLHFDENDESNLSFNEEMSISQDNIFGTNFEPQEVSFNGSFFTPLEECIESKGFKGIITQEGHADITLVRTQGTHIQGKIYESLKIGKLLPSLLSFDYVVFILKPPFNDPPRPKMVDYSLTKPP